MDDDVLIPASVAAEILGCTPAHVRGDLGAALGEQVVGVTATGKRRVRYSYLRVLEVATTRALLRARRINRQRDRAQRAEVME